VSNKEIGHQRGSKKDLQLNTASYPLKYILHPMFKSLLFLLSLVRYNHLKGNPQIIKNFLSTIQRIESERAFEGNSGFVCLDYITKIDKGDTIGEYLKTRL
jgi:hypothetical protein